MSDESLGTCPDCGQEYRDPHEVMPPPTPCDNVEFTPMPWAEYAAQTHQDFECPVYKERELVEELKAALRYFGVADLLAKVGEIMREDEHDSEYIWGNAERWFKREGAQPGGRSLHCPKCGVQLGTVQGERFKFGSAFIELSALNGSEELHCRGCDTALNLKEALAAPGEGKQAATRALSLVQPPAEEPRQKSGGIGGGGVEEG